MPAVEIYRTALVELGAHKIAHQDKRLIDHLEETYWILQRMQCAEHVCLAGLFHGIYGTQGLHAEKVGALAEGRRERVTALIGERAERLVFSFSIIDYNALGHSLRNVLRPEGQPAMRDRRTSAPISMDREEFNELLQVKLADIFSHVPAQKVHSQVDLPAEYGTFWQIVAEHLGCHAVATWNDIIGGSLWICPQPN